MTRHERPTSPPPPPIATPRPPPRTAAPAPGVLHLRGVEPGGVVEVHGGALPGRAAAHHRPWQTGAVSLPLSGWRVVVTGDVPGLSRDAAQEAVRTMGGTVASSVTPSTDLLVVGTGAGASKLAKAAALGIRQLPAAPFAELAENPDRWDGRPLGELPEDDVDALAPPERAERRAAPGRRTRPG